MIAQFVNGVNIILFHTERKILNNTHMKNGNRFNNQSISVYALVPQLAETGWSQKPLQINDHIVGAHPT